MTQRFTYVGTEPRYYPELGVEAEPDTPCVIDVDPGDGRWQPTKDAVTDQVLPPQPSPGDDDEVSRQTAHTTPARATRKAPAKAASRRSAIAARSSTISCW